MLPQTVCELLYLDDIPVGQKFGSDRQALDEGQIKALSAQFDPQPCHLDEQAASNSLFGGLAARNQAGLIIWADFRTVFISAIAVGGIKMGK